jgi:asparagine synthase (glutamine-hydrolysing)
VEPSAQRLVLARDPGGNRRLFVHEADGALHFSSRLSDLPDLLGDGLEVDRSTEDFLLGYEFWPGDRTAYRGVRVLEPGTLLEWVDGRVETSSIEADRPWEGWLNALDPEDDSEDTAIEGLHEAFFRALEEQAPAADRVAVVLGGFDSALVTSALVRMGKEVETFSFRYADAAFNQPHTEELARLLGIRHNWVPITSEVLDTGIRSFAESFNQPVSQIHYLVNTAEVCRAVRARGIVHAVTGDGCDGLFLGYPTVYQRAVLIERLARLPKPLLQPMLKLLSIPALERMLGQPYRVARNVIRVLGRSMPARAHIASCILDSVSLSQLRAEPPPAQDSGTEEILTELARGLEDVSSIRLAYRGKGAVGLNKNKLEGSSAGSGVALSSPYLHPGMAAFAARLPEELSRPTRPTDSAATGKYALMRMAEKEQLLPSEIIHQKKMSPVTSPVDAWYMGSLRPTLLDALSGLPFEVDRRYAESLTSKRLSEGLFRRHIGLSHYTSQAIGLLSTYASFTRPHPSSGMKR